jgi:hypothetical protein
MKSKHQLWLAIALAAVCIGGIIGVVSNKSSVREYLDQNYERAASATAVPGATARTITYQSDQPPSATADQIGKEWDPAQRQDQPAGTFLRYNSSVVGVTPSPDGGSFISYDQPDDGYARWFPYVGGFWGTGLGTGEGFRSGGPGGGGK